MRKPRVFVSHASADKDRFVIPFARKLLEKGIDAWVDNWELVPGDSLVDRIFEEGIKNADAIIVVLSEHSIRSRWVREEINASFVERVNKGSKLIPIIIDQCEVPTALQSTVWVRIDDLSNHDEELEQVSNAVFDRTDKPDVGEPPRYASTPIDVLPGLTKTDSLVLVTTGSVALRTGMESVDVPALLRELAGADVAEEMALESIDVLDRKHLIKAERGLGKHIPALRLTRYGFDQFARVHVDGYEDMFRRVCFSIVNEKHHNNDALSRGTETPIVIVNHVLEKLAAKHLLRLSQASSGFRSYFSVSPELRRILSEDDGLSRVV